MHSKSIRCIGKLVFIAQREEWVEDRFYHKVVLYLDCSSLSLDSKVADFSGMSFGSICRTGIYEIFCHPGRGEEVEEIEEFPKGYLVNLRLSKPVGDEAAFTENRARELGQYIDAEIEFEIEEAGEREAAYYSGDVNDILRDIAWELGL